MPKILTEEFKKEIRDFYLIYPMSYTYVAKKFHICKPTVAKILAGLPVYTRSVIFSPELQENYFNVIDSERKAYFLGLIVSDGNVFVHDGKRIHNQSKVSITLDSHDEYLLDIFKSELRSNRVITHDGRGCSEIMISSSTMVNDLSKYGIVPRKSFFTKLPDNIPDEFLGAFIRGVLEGDGNVTYKETKRRFVHVISFCGSHQLMCDIGDKLHELGIITHKRKVYDYKDRVLSEFKISRKDDIFSLYSWMYKDATVYMKRKKDKFDFIRRFYGFV